MERYGHDQCKKTDREEKRKAATIRIRYSSPPIQEMPLKEKQEERSKKIFHLKETAVSAALTDIPYTNVAFSYHLLQKLGSAW